MQRFETKYGPKFCDLDSIVGIQPAVVDGHQRDESGEWITTTNGCSVLLKSGQSMWLPITSERMNEVRDAFRDGITYDESCQLANAALHRE